MANGAGSGAALRKIAESVSGPMGPMPFRNTRYGHSVFKISSSDPPRDSVGVLVFFKARSENEFFKNIPKRSPMLKERQVPVKT
jgi:hypothetical protein